MDGGLEDPQASPLERLLEKDVLDRYEAALAKLPAEEQSAILLRVELDCSWALIAKETGRPSPDAARMAVTRALLRLAEEMIHASESH